MNTYEMKIKINSDSPLPVYKQVKEQLLLHISESGLIVGARLPDIRSIASIAGVSVMTVNKALNQLVEEGYCYRRPKKGTFVGNFEGLTAKKRLCGVCYSGSYESFEQDVTQGIIYRGISRRAHELDSDVFFLSREPFESISFYMARSKIDLKGLVMLHWEELDTGNKLAKEFPNIKFVYLNHLIENFEETPPNVFGIFNDEFAGAYQMTEHLLSKGHKKIAALTAS